MRPQDFGFFAWALRALHVPDGVTEDEAQRFRIESYDDPKGFVDALAASAPLPLPRKSDLHAGIDLWSDLVAAWSDGPADRIVLRHHDALTGWQTLTYRELATRSIVLRDALVQRGCVAGDLLALVLPFGPDFLIGFCAALHLGLQLAPLSPSASELISRQLTQLQPHTIYTASRYRRLLPAQVQDAVMLVDASVRRGASSMYRLSAASVPSSHTYAGDDPVLQLCSPLSTKAPSGISTRSARAMYGDALRDALLLGLYSQGEGSQSSSLSVHVMAPGLHLIQHAPSFLAAVLSAGATIVDVSADEAPRDPQRWRRGQVPVHHLFLPTDLTTTEQSALLQCAADGALLELRRLFICPFLIRANPALRSLAAWLTQGALASVVATYLHLDSASGGAVLYSNPLRGALAKALHIAPGCRHRLEDPQRPGQPTSQARGRLRIRDVSADIDGELLLARLPSGYFLGGTQTPRRLGRSFPKDLLLSFLRDRGIAEDCTIVQQAGHADGEFHLLIFGGAQAAFESDTDDRDTLSADAIRDEISINLGSQCVPDRIIVLPIHPRRRNGLIDQSFYQSGHDTGLTARLCRDPALLAISTLRGLTRRVREVQ